MMMMMMMIIIIIIIIVVEPLLLKRRRTKIPASASLNQAILGCSMTILFDGSAGAACTCTDVSSSCVQF
jgi:hypothetical protein